MIAACGWTEAAARNLSCWAFADALANRLAPALPPPPCRCPRPACAGATLSSLTLAVPVLRARLACFAVQRPRRTVAGANLSLTRVERPDLTTARGDHDHFAGWQSIISAWTVGALTEGDRDGGGDSGEVRGDQRRVGPAFCAPVRRPGRGRGCVRVGSTRGTEPGLGAAACASLQADVGRSAQGWIRW